MASKILSRVELLRGTLDLLILRTLLPGPSHGHAIAKHIQRTSEDLLQVETGSLYPALYRLGVEAVGGVPAVPQHDGRFTGVDPALPGELANDPIHDPPDGSSLNAWAVTARFCEAD